MSGSSIKDHRNSVQSFQSDDQKVRQLTVLYLPQLTIDTGGISNSTGLSNEDINAAADAAQSMPTNLSQSEYQIQDLDTPKREDTDADVWGIKGLLGIIKIEDSDKSKLALGVDLTSLGLNMNQPEYPFQKVKC